MKSVARDDSSLFCWNARHGDFAITVIAIRTERVNPSIPILLSFLVVGQAMLGMWTVTLKLMPVIVMLHLLGGFTLLALQAVFYCQLKAKDNLYFPLLSVG